MIYLLKWPSCCYKAYHKIRYTLLLEIMPNNKYKRLGEERGAEGQYSNVDGKTGVGRAFPDFRSSKRTL